MKKALTILVAMLFLVGAVGAVYAAETTFNGQYKVRAWSNWNFDKRVITDTSERGRYDGYFDQRFRLTITHTRSEFLKAVVQLDLVEDTWGQQRNFRINNSTVGNFVRKAYIEFTLPKIGTFTVGKQPALIVYKPEIAAPGINAD
jgi:predicted porin